MVYLTKFSAAAARRMAVWCVLTLPLLLPAQTPTLNDGDEGRLVVRSGFAIKGDPGGLLVFQETLADGRLSCTEFLNSNRVVTVRREEVRPLEFHRSCRPYAVENYALRAMAVGNFDRVYLQLTRYYDSPRGAKIREMETAVNDQLPSLSKVLVERRRRVEEEKNSSSQSQSQSQFQSSFQSQLSNQNLLSYSSADDPVDTIENGRPIALISEAISDGDFFRATAMFEYYRNSVKKLLGRGDEDVEEYLKDSAQQLVNSYRNRRLAMTTREQEFSKVCPLVAGAWSMAPPDTYSGMLKLFENSFNAFCRLDRLSTLAEFPEWGSASLDAMLLLTNSSASVEPGEEFDREFAAYKVRSGMAQGK